jgi:hypothetical protein
MWVDDEEFIFLLRDDNDIYSEAARNRMVEDDEITARDAAIIQGFEAA